MKEIILPKRCELISDCFFRIEELVLLCAIKAIETAMSETDPNWFAAFKTAEAAEDKPIIVDKANRVVASVDYLDFQAAMKIFAYRKERFAPVFKKYGISADDGSDFLLLLQRLIKTRNEISGHFDVKSILSKYSKTDSDAARRLILRFREGILDFIAFLNFFPDVCDQNGVTYLSIAEKENANTEKLFNVFQYSIEETIEEEDLPVTVAVFEQLCKRVGVRYSSDDDGNSYFETENYGITIKSIKALIEEMNKQNAPAAVSKADNKKIWVYIIAAILIVILITLLLGKAFWGDKDNGQSSSTPSVPSVPSVSFGSSQESTPAESSTVQEPDEAVITGKARLGGLTVRIDGVPSQYLTFEYENDGANSYSFGWVPDYSQVIVETSVRKYYGTVSGTMVKLNKDSEGTFNASFDDEFEGTIKKITITRMTPLNDAGLPQGEVLTLKIPIEYK